MVLNLSYSENQTIFHYVMLDLLRTTKPKNLVIFEVTLLGTIRPSDAIWFMVWSIKATIHIYMYFQFLHQSKTNYSLHLSKIGTSILFSLTLIRNFIYLVTFLGNFPFYSIQINLLKWEEPNGFEPILQKSPILLVWFAELSSHSNWFG